MGCAKKAYPSKTQALKRASNIEAEEGRSLWAYECLRCGNYHLTSKRPAKRSYKQKRDGKRVRGA
jgi:hypothetical protein